MRQVARSKQWWQAMDRRTFGKGTLAFATLAGMSGCKGRKKSRATHSICNANTVGISERSKIGSFSAM